MSEKPYCVCCLATFETDVMYDIHQFHIQNVTYACMLAASLKINIRQGKCVLRICELCSCYIRDAHRFRLKVLSSLHQLDNHAVLMAEDGEIINVTPFENVKLENLAELEVSQNEGKIYLVGGNKFHNSDTEEFSIDEMNDYISLKDLSNNLGREKRKKLNIPEKCSKRNALLEKLERFSDFGDDFNDADEDYCPPEKEIHIQKKVVRKSLAALKKKKSKTEKILLKNSSDPIKVCDSSTIKIIQEIFRNKKEVLNPNPLPRPKIAIVEDDTPIKKKQKYKPAPKPYVLDYTTLQCGTCGETFKNGHMYRIHMNVHFPNFVCDQCGKGFIAKNRYKYHMLSHQKKQSTYDCTTCGLTFRSINTLGTHKQRKHGNRFVHKCQMCDERFDSYLRKVKHMVQKHEWNEKNYDCDYCERTFFTSTARSGHVRRSHLKDKFHVCNICGKSFYSRGDYGGHMSHFHNLGDVHFRCDVCEKSFAAAKGLREHMKIHNNDKRHTCHVCGRAFVQKGALKGHMRTHEKQMTIADPCLDNPCLDYSPPIETT